MEAAKIIDLLGGDVRLAEAHGLVRTTVFAWRTGGIPAARALAICEGATKEQLKSIVLAILLDGGAEKQPAPRPNGKQPRGSVKNLEQPGANNDG